MFDFLTIRKSVAALGSKVTEHKHSIEKLQREREEIAAAAPTREDVIRLISSRIDEVGAEYPQDLQRALGGVLHSGKLPNLQGWPLGFLLPQGNGAGTSLSAPTLMHGLAFLLGAEIKESVARAVERMEWPAGAIPLATREKELARLDGEIGKLGKELADLSSEAAKAGIRLE